MWFERDESDHRRVPVLLHRVKVRVSDSLHPMKGSKAIFRIEVSVKHNSPLDGRILIAYFIQV